MERLQKWRAALTEAANIAGWDLQNLANGYESKFIEKIVEEVLHNVNPVHLHVAVHPVGIDSRVEKMKALLDLGTNDVRIVGIYGMGGIGKTTIAKAVYNKIRHGFEGSSCLLNIKEVSEQHNGLVNLQEQLLSDILKRKLKIGNVDRGINLIKERLCCKRVLVVLDDVDHFKQLNSLAGDSKWFGPGSRVIATTRDAHLLSELGVDGKYKVEDLDHEESLQLFSWHAFRMSHPNVDFRELSIGVVNYVKGLPLALEVMGSYLLGRSIIEWKNALEKLQRIPHRQIQEILRISFDSLDDETVKDIFLDIACFFIGRDRDYVHKILDGCGFFPAIGISILIQRSLLTVNENNDLRMHDLVRDMGREIVREKSPSDPGKRNRLWFHEDVLNVLSKHLGSEAVEGLILNLHLEDVHLKTEAFAKMRNLRLLQVDGVHLTGSNKDLFKELRWLHWHNCRLKFLPPSFHLENLVILDMQYSSVKEVWKEIKILNKLKVLDLSHSRYLTKSPNFFEVPQLEILILQDCSSLVGVHESIGSLEKLVLLNLEGCKNLKNLPESISSLKSLEILNLCGCLKLDELPDQMGKMMALKELLADRTAIKQLPSTCGLLKNLETISLSGCRGQSSKSWWSRFLAGISLRRSNTMSLLPASVSGLCSLRKLDVSDCNLSEDGIPIDLGCLSSLEELDLSKNNFRSLSHCIGRLSKLSVFRLNECTSLHSISELPSSLYEFYANGCTSLQSLPHVWNLEGSAVQLHMERCDNLAYDFRNSLSQVLSLSLSLSVSVSLSLSFMM
ncbi:TMV resistance protein N [Morella rubra]|uniref:TMV resistance protein N n=1 Tax=Morella rubra TaxID=262757 RepID=A0A6A1W5J4_9ROSI|nr:TMV resistance protein N [Morella rubra]